MVAFSEGFGPGPGVRLSCVRQMRASNQNGAPPNSACRRSNRPFSGASPAWSRIWVGSRSSWGGGAKGAAAISGSPLLQPVRSKAAAPPSLRRETLLWL